MPSVAFRRFCQGLALGAALGAAATLALRPTAYEDEEGVQTAAPAEPAAGLDSLAPSPAPDVFEGGAAGSPSLMPLR